MTTNIWEPCDFIATSKEDGQTMLRKWYESSISSLEESKGIEFESWQQTNDSGNSFNVLLVLCCETREGPAGGCPGVACNRDSLLKASTETEPSSILFIAFEQKGLEYRTVYGHGLINWVPLKTVLE